MAHINFRTSNLRQIHEEKVHNASTCHEDGVVMSEASTSREDRIVWKYFKSIFTNEVQKITVNAVSSNTILPQRRAILQGRLAAAKAQQMNNGQKQLFPVKMITVFFSNTIQYLFKFYILAAQKSAVKFRSSRSGAIHDVSDLEAPFIDNSTFLFVSLSDHPTSESFKCTFS